MLHPNRRVEKLGDPLQASSKGSLFVTRAIRSVFAGIVLSTFSGLFGLPRAVSFALRRLCANISMSASQSCTVSWSNGPSLGVLRSPLRLLVQKLDGLYSMERYADEEGDRPDLSLSIPSDMSEKMKSRCSSNEGLHKVSPEELLKDWEIVKDAYNDEAQRSGYFGDIKGSSQALIDELNRLTDECDDLSNEQWSEIIASLDAH